MDVEKKGYWINELESLSISPNEIERYYQSESDCIKELANHQTDIIPRIQNFL